LLVRTFLFFALILSTSVGATGCAYHFGLSDRALPGGYTQLAIPVFKNSTQDVGIEMYFTDALIRRFARSQVARVTDKDVSPVVLEGAITKIVTTPGPARTNGPENTGLVTLPDNAVLTTSYRLMVTADIKLRRKSDDKIVWQGNFQNESEYFSPQVGTPIVNSINATYNQNARHHTIANLAEELMSEAHDRLTENF
jgi:hypothetical protein